MTQHQNTPVTATHSSTSLPLPDCAFTFVTMNMATRDARSKNKLPAAGDEPAAGGTGAQKIPADAAADAPVGGKKKGKGKPHSKQKKRKTVS